MWDPKRPFVAGKNFWHCEDHAYFLYETQGKGEGISDGHYPENILVTYGSVAGLKVGVVDPCFKTTNRRPKTCKAVAADLQIHVLTMEREAQLQGPVAEAPPGVSDIEGTTAADDSSDSLEVVEICPPGSQKRDHKPAIRGRTLQRRDTNASANCIPPPASLSLPALTVQLNLPASDFQNTLSTTSSPGGSITQGPTTTPSCVLHNQDPDQFISSAFCLCDATVTLPLISVPPKAAATSQCAYTTIPSSAIITTNPTLAVTTDLKSCQVCTRVVNNEDSCSSIKGCTTSPSPTKPPTETTAPIQSGAAVTVEAGSSPVHLGTLTGKALSTSISSALSKLCPTPSKAGAHTACSTKSVKIKGIPYKSGEFLSEGELVVSVESSSYNQSQLRKAMIDTAAHTAVQAANDTNCYDTTYKTSPAGGLSRFGRRDTPVTFSEHKARWCNTVGFAGVQYFQPGWRQQRDAGASDWIDARWAFDTGPGGDFECVILEGLVDAFAVLAPEFAIGDIALGEEIRVICEQAVEGKEKVKRRQIGT